MNLANTVCNREQAVSLQHLGIAGPITHNGDTIPGIIMSVILTSTGAERIIQQDSQEDVPYAMYQPVRLYTTLELLTMLGTYNLRMENNRIATLKTPIPGTLKFDQGNVWMGELSSGMLPFMLASTVLSLLMDEALHVETINSRLNTLWSPTAQTDAS